ncbi:MAG: C-terminal binding protein [Stomatobaculum sp.]
MLIWIIDEEWKDYDLEREILEKRYPGVEIRHSGYDYEKDLQEFGFRADGIFAQVYAKIPEKTIARLENCKGIAVYGGGYDLVDTAAARRKGISVTNISGYCASDLADYVVAAMYFANKNIAGYSRGVVSAAREGRWGATAVDRILPRLSGQILGIAGLGVIGKETAKHAGALGMKVIAADDFCTKEEMAALGVEKVNFEELYRRSDYVSIHLKGCEENENKVDSASLAGMKRTAWLINTSRGRVVDETALIQAVREKKIAGAILDVIKNEPPCGDEEILHCEGIYVTPHVSYISTESFRALKEYAIQNLIAMIEGGQPRDLIN